MSGEGTSKEQQFAVVSRRVVFVVGSALLIGGVFAILNDQVVLGIALVVVASLAVMWRGMLTVRRGRRVLADRERAQVPDGAVRGADAPAPVEDVVAQLPTRATITPVNSARDRSRLRDSSMTMPR